MRVYPSTNSPPDDMPDLLGRRSERRTPRRPTEAAGIVCVPTDVLNSSDRPPRLLRVGTSLAQNSLQKRVAGESDIVALATPAASDRGPTHWLSLSGKRLFETLGLRDGEKIRRAALEGVLREMFSDRDEWSHAVKSVDGTRTFLIRCRNHLGRLAKIENEHTFIHTASRAASTSAATLWPTSRHNFLYDINLAKAKVGEWITRAVLQTGTSLHIEFLEQIEQLCAQRGTVHEPAAYRHIGVLERAIEDMPFLAESSKKELFMSLNQLKKTFDDK